MSKNVVEPEKLQTIWHMRVACWIRNATCMQAHARARAPTHTRMHMHAFTHARIHTKKYVTLLAFAWQNLYHEWKFH
jgi:hypothetical protein